MQIRRDVFSLFPSCLLEVLTCVCRVLLLLRCIDFFFFGPFFFPSAEAGLKGGTVFSLPLAAPLNASVRFRLEDGHLTFPCSFLSIACPPPGLSRNILMFFFFFGSFRGEPAAMRRLMPPLLPRPPAHRKRDRPPFFSTALTGLRPIIPSVRDPYVSFPRSSTFSLPKPLFPQPPPRRFSWNKHELPLFSRPLLFGTLPPRPLAPGIHADPPPFFRRPLRFFSRAEDFPCF